MGLRKGGVITEAIGDVMTGQTILTKIFYDTRNSGSLLVEIMGHGRRAFFIATKLK
jgi:hypothetical protein